jgi:hypothetical protein
MIRKTNASASVFSRQFSFFVPPVGLRSASIYPVDRFRPPPTARRQPHAIGAFRP